MITVEFEWSDEDYVVEVMFPEYPTYPNEIDEITVIQGTEPPYGKLGPTATDNEKKQHWYYGRFLDEVYKALDEYAESARDAHADRRLHELRDSGRI